MVGTETLLNTKKMSITGYLSLEDALDLNLCMSFNLSDFENREPFNIFKIHFDEQIG